MRPKPGAPGTDQFVPHRDFDRPKRQEMKRLIRVDLQSRHRCAQRIDVPRQHQDFFAWKVFQLTPDRGKGKRTRAATAVVDLGSAPTRPMPGGKGLNQIEKIAGSERLTQPFSTLPGQQLGMDPSQDIVKRPACEDRFDVSVDGCYHFRRFFDIFFQGSKSKDFGVEVTLGVCVDMCH